MNTAAEEIINRWRGGVQEFTVLSSGTTGNPSAFVLKRRLIELSCRHTGAFLGVKPDDRILCCLPLDRVGGLMQLFRSEVWGIPVEVIPASLTPLTTAHLPASITSMTPLQLLKTAEDEEQLAELLKFRIILIGGADIPDSLEKQISIWQGPRFLHTYGMTETYSHIAMREAGREDTFRCIMPTELGLNEEGCLRLRNEITEEKWLQTRDTVKLLPDGRFRITGRADDIINSGGAKVQPAEVEAIIREHSQLPEGSFFIGGLPDAASGEKVVLVLMRGTAAPDLKTIPFPASYMRPKEIISVDRFIYTETQKLKRRETLAQR